MAGIKHIKLRLTTNPVGQVLPCIGFLDFGIMIARSVKAAVNAGLKIDRKASVFQKMYHIIILHSPLPVSAWNKGKGLKFFK